MSCFVYSSSGASGGYWIGISKLVILEKCSATHAEGGRLILSFLGSLFLPISIHLWQQALRNKFATRHNLNLMLVTFNIRRWITAATEANWSQASSAASACITRWGGGRRCVDITHRRTRINTHLLIPLNRSHNFTVIYLSFHRHVDCANEQVAADSVRVSNFAYYRIALIRPRLFWIAALIVIAINNCKRKQTRASA